MTGGPGVPEQTRVALELMAQSPAQEIGVRDVTEIRAALRAGALSSRSAGERDDGVTFRDESLSPALLVRMYRPPNPVGPPVLFIHGGGWVICDIETHHELACQLAADTGSIVASVEYRLAPEYPFPAPLDDCRSAARWLAAAVPVASGSSSGIVVVGDSSGGNLAAALALAAAGDPELPRILLQVLIYPVLDDDLSSPSYRSYGAGGFGLSTAQMRWYWDAYAPTADVRSDPLAAPGKSADLAGVAPAFVVVGEFDPLVDEARAYVEALRNAGVPVSLREYPGGFHGFYSFRGVLDIAEDAAADVARAIMAVRDELMGNEAGSDPEPAQATGG